jgi:hypothetical protein
MSEIRYIGINQRVPIVVLENAIIYLLRGELRFKEEVLRDLSEHFEGKNRIEKGYLIIRRILLMTGFSKEIQKNFTENSYMSLQESERRAILLLLIAEAYPFAMDLMSIIIKTLRVQPSVNVTYIKTQLAILYGSNRTMFLAKDALLSMFVELRIYERPKSGLYSLHPPLPIYTLQLSALVRSKIADNAEMMSYFMLP